jgi:hypothetical protein
MAGSLTHIVDEKGKFTMDYIYDLDDARDALEECFQVLYRVTGGSCYVLNPILEKLKFPKLTVDMDGSE